MSWILKMTECFSSWPNVKQCTVTLVQALLRCVSMCFEACALMQCCPIVSHKVTRCQPLSHLTLLAKLLHASPLMSFPSYSLTFLFPCHSQGDSPSLTATAAFPRFVLGAFSADKRWEQARLSESREGEAREDAVWKWEETDKILKQETGMDAFLNTCTRHIHKQLQWHQEMEILAWPRCFFKQSRWLTVVTSKWESVSVHHSQHKFCRNLGRGF